MARSEGVPCRFKPCVNKSRYRDGYCSGHRWQRSQEQEMTPLKVFRDRSQPPPTHCICGVQLSDSRLKTSNYVCPRCHHLWNRYKMTYERYDLILASQGGVCAICRTLPKGTARDYLCVDHDHSCCSAKGRSCGECIRGLLCTPCNLAIGYFKDSIEVAQNAVEYLKSTASDLYRSRG